MGKEVADEGHWVPLRVGAVLCFPNSLLMPTAISSKGA